MCVGDTAGRAFPPILSWLELVDCFLTLLNRLFVPQMQQLAGDAPAAVTAVTPVLTLL